PQGGSLMFYCEDCREKHGYPATADRSPGECELCGCEALCHDCPSRYLKATYVMTEEEKASLKDFLASRRRPQAHVLLSPMAYPIVFGPRSTHRRSQENGDGSPLLFALLLMTFLVASWVCTFFARGKHEALFASLFTVSATATLLVV